MADKPISPLLYSNFIELGYGIQVDFSLISGDGTSK
jgi:hypothetical protein